ncbi:MAG: HEPN domain-containing protein [Saprospiraceae bacterium]|nr:hypothetical protein [Lewinella sp.]
MNKQVSFEVEAYALFKNVDETLLKLNPIIRKDGYEFVLFDFAELEEKFSDLYSLPKKYEIKKRIKLGPDKIVSYEFLSAYGNHSFGENTIHWKKKTLFLKRIESFHRPVTSLLNDETEKLLFQITEKEKRSGFKAVLDKLESSHENAINVETAIKIGGEFQRFKNELIRKLQLFKNGDLICPVEFQIEKSSREIVYILTAGVSKPSSNNSFSISDEEVEKLRIHLSQDLESTALTELAESLFFSSYEVHDYKVRFTILMSALESLFNRSKDQISHIIARHLALIISSGKEEFETMYNRVKKLYGIRSQIVHGQSVKFKEDIIDQTNELQDLTRTAILYCMKSKKTKDELFSYLNAKGY